MFLKNLNIIFDHEDLDYIRTYILDFHLSIKDELSVHYDPGNAIHKPSLGYYLPLYTNTHRSRKVASWENFENIKTNKFYIDKIKMKISKTHHQNLYVINMKCNFDEIFFKKIESILNKINIDFQKISTTICVQELGYSMKFHKDSGVQSRIHINLNRKSFDYFYTDEGSFQLKFGECYLFEASKTSHSFMSFQQEPRIHLIMDII